MAKKQARRVERVMTYFNATYGTIETRLESWQQLCRDIGVVEAGSITACKKELRGIHVSIFDFVEALQRGQPMRQFGSRNALRQHLQRTGDFFPLKKAKENMILKWMLIETRKGPAVFF